ncbi:hypothetical protein JQ596_29800 [Bradyrhizobium manausense]|uniref:DUF5672 family protein n=1 Tax=Bradyrhizobium TaxID=374 RepID=UPI001BAA43DE|nr:MULTISPECIES: DUF5672 family protein [Bradyrhizobium]MBR0829734.1 hypothetical protein [Bradyrhizobium manausense]UVO25347.1 hypothetical protein KUF59_22335 [Bradyrhizobium arachidis]
MQPAGPATTSKLDLTDVTICAIDSVNVAATAAALDRSIRSCAFGDAILFSHEQLEGPFRCVRIDPVGSTAAYSEFLYKHMPRLIETPFVLVVQWDGYVVDPAAWKQDFRRYDYIGAPWPFVSDGFSVGNGGFSLQSQKLLRAMLDDRFLLRLDVNSDWQVCRAFRSQLESEFGLRFAPQAVAETFSYETLSVQEFTGARPPTFGFHGIGNMWRYVDDAEMIAMTRRLSPHVFASPQYANLLVTYFLLGRYKTFAALYARLKAHRAVDTAALIRKVVGEANHDVAALFAGLGDRLIARQERAWMLAWDLRRARRGALDRLAGVGASA